MKLEYRKLTKEDTGVMKNAKLSANFDERIAQSFFDHIPIGVGSKGINPMNARDVKEALEVGMNCSLREGNIWAEDKEHCEEYGRMLNGDPSKVSMRAKSRSPKVGYLGHWQSLRTDSNIQRDIR